MEGYDVHEIRVEPRYLKLRVKRWLMTKRSDSKNYIIALTIRGTYQCSCSEWIYHREHLPEGHCKHIRIVISHYGDLRSEEQSAVSIKQSKPKRKLIW